MDETSFAPATSTTGSATKMLMVVAVVAVVASFAVVISQLSTRSTGYAPYSSGNATLEIEGRANINFTKDLINWSTGYVNDTAPGCSYAVLETPNNNDGCAVNWLEDTGLVIENYGNTNVTLELRTQNDADSFIGGTNPTYNWSLSDTNANGACELTTGGVWSGFVPVATSDYEVCTSFLAKDFLYPSEITIDLQVLIPNDASQGQRLDTITATATAYAP